MKKVDDQTVLETISNAALLEDIETARSILDSIVSFETMQKVMDHLNEDRFDGKAGAAYVLADIHSRYDESKIAVVLYIKAAQLGLPSAYYLAAQEIEKCEEHGQDLGWSHERLIACAAEQGHVWSTFLLLMRSRGSIGSRLKYLAFRMIVGPYKVIRASINPSRRDQIRY